MILSSFRRLCVPALALVVAVGCGGSAGPEGTAPQLVRLDGSSTVFPISEAVAEEFRLATGINVTVGISGTGGGFQ
ncbi:MAG: hypothetical protein ACLGHP_07715, partial [Vicinamibacteria bacterium]